MNGGRAIWIVAALALAATPAIFAAWPALPGALPGACLLRAVWGVPCPGCGMTRAVALLLSGDLAGSVGQHALAVPILLGLAACVLFRAGLIRVRPGRRISSGAVALALLIVLFHHAVRLGGMLAAGTLDDAFRSGAIFRAASWFAGLF